MTGQRLSLGKKGEEIARRHLERQGYKILAANYRTRNGEIDLIARDGATLVFIEVKTRMQDRFGSPFEALSNKKCRSISKVALEYLLSHGGLEQPARFDVVSVLPGEEMEVEVLRNAFDLCYP
ncbi:MAG: YraN family protein [Deltaproteobacteria bacterium]|nr:YraN family protein [Deltaproteobacteria bacterium]